MSAASSSSSSGVSVLGLLGVLFVGLKLGHVIDWSWWLVTLPFWGGAAAVLAVLAVLAVVGVVALMTAVVRRMP